MAEILLKTQDLSRASRLAGAGGRGPVLPAVDGVSFKLVFFAYDSDFG